MILSTAECKALLDESSSTYDTIIGTLLPYAQDDLFDYVGKYHLLDPLITYTMSEASIVSNSTNDYITDGQSDFVNKRFAAGMDVYVEGWDANEGIYELKTVVAGTLTLTSASAVVSMAYNDTYYQPGALRISKINWPRGLELVAARMVWYLVKRNKPTGELSEVKDGVSKNYDRRRSYPREIMQMADRYRVARFV